MCDIYDFWFPEGNKYQKWWFQGKVNSDSQKRVNDFILNIQVNDYEWFRNPRNLLSGILFSDQLFRHINIHNEVSHKKAVEYTLYAIQQDWLDKYEPHEIVFVLMPFRHMINEPDSLHYLNFCKEYLFTREDANNKHIQRFLKALNKQKGINILFYNSLSRLAYTDPYKVLCQEHHYLYEPKFIIENTKIYKQFIKFIQNPYFNNELCDGKKHFIISLSGGVDSMVCLYLCYVYKEINPNFSFSCIHINWNQRKESEYEMDFLINYCNSNNIEIKYYNITHLSRSEDRTKFETETRELRFQYYRDLIKQKNNNAVVFMGHHRGDIVENVFTNMIRGINYMNLKKMEFIQNINNVTIVRPFLSLDKSNIWEVALKKHIPFFKDTTPDWSNRGSVRRRIFPAIKKQFPNFEQGLITMGERSTQMNILVEKLIIDKYMNNVKYEDTKAYLPYDLDIQDYPIIFYEIVFEKICHLFNVSKLSIKSLKHFYKNYIKKQGVTKKWKYSVNKNIELIYDGTYIIINFNKK